MHLFKVLTSLISIGCEIIQPDFATIDLLDDPHLSYLDEKQFNAIRIRVFVTALSTLIEAYRNSRDMPIQHIISGLRNLSEILRRLCSKIRNQEKQGIDIQELREESEGVHIIADFLGKFEGIDDDITPANLINLQITSINAAFARTISQAIESLALIENSSYIYYKVLTLFNRIESQTETPVNYMQEFEKNMWGKIAKNVVQRHYPATLRVYLIYFGGRLIPDCFQPNEWVNGILERIRRLLYIDLKPLLDKNAQMVNVSS